MTATFARERWCLLLVDAALVFGGTQVSGWARAGYIFDVLETHTGATLFTLLIHLLTFYIFDLYNTKRDFRTKDSILRMALAISLAGVSLTTIFYSVPVWKFGRGILFIQLLATFCLLAGWRVLYSRISRSVPPTADILVIGAGRAGRALYDLLNSYRSPYRIIGFVDDDPQKLGREVGSPVVLGTTKDLMDVAREGQIRTAVLAIIKDRSRELIRRVLEARLSGLNIVEMPSLVEQITGRVPVEYIADDWLLFADGFNLLSKEYMQKLKRIFDFAISSLLLFAVSPIILLTALLIRLDSAGPIFFKQNRMGIGGATFVLWKFRSMRLDAEANGAVWAEKDDHRITRIGKGIRRLRIDELPQLINVFRGDMSVIGPRPERPEFVRDLARVIPYYSVRHSVRPGITGWAQINYPYGASIEDALRKLEYDLYYVKNMSILLDVQILLRTVGVVLFREGSR